MGYRTLIDDAVLLTDVALRWCARQVGEWGAATVLIGLIDPAGEGGKATRPVELVAVPAGSSDLARVQRARTLEDFPRAEISADLSATATAQERLAVAHHALASCFRNSESSSQPDCP